MLKKERCFYKKTHAYFDSIKKLPFKLIIPVFIRIYIILAEENIRCQRDISVDSIKKLPFKLIKKLPFKLIKTLIFDSFSAVTSDLG